MAPRVPPLESEAMDSALRPYLERAEARGAPNALLLRVMAHDPSSLRIFYEAWEASFYGGRVDHGLKELMRVRMALLRGCRY
jgi:alkylhydroperoxidase family enzyme